MSNQLISFPLTESNFNNFLIAFYSSSAAQNCFNLLACKSEISRGHIYRWVYLSLKSGSGHCPFQALYYLGRYSV